MRFHEFLPFFSPFPLALLARASRPLHEPVTSASIGEHLTKSPRKAGNTRNLPRPVARVIAPVLATWPQIVGSLLDASRPIRQARRAAHFQTATLDGLLAIVPYSLDRLPGGRNALKPPQILEDFAFER